MLCWSDGTLCFFWLGSCGCGCCCRGAALGVVAGFADVDAALEEGAVLDGDAGGDDVAGERTFAADVDAVRCLAVATDFAENDDLAGCDIRCYLAVAANGDAVAGEVDGSFNLSVNVEGFGA